MTDTLLRAGALACALMTTTALTAPAMAQAGQTTPPDTRSVDANGVDLISGDYAFSFTEAAIGADEGALAATRSGTNGAGANSWQNMWLEQTVAGSTVIATVILGDHSETFTKTPGFDFTADLANGATLTGTMGSDYVYVAADGTTITFGAPVSDLGGASDFCSHANAEANGCKALALSAVRPNGARFNFTWDVRSNCINLGQVSDCAFVWRLDKVANNYGYEIDFAFASNSYSFSSGTPDFFVQAGASLSNLNVSGETPLTVSYSRPSSGILDVTVPGPTTSAGLTWRFTSGTGTFAIRRPGSSADNISVAYGSSGVTAVTRDGVTTNYARTVSGNAATTTITENDGDANTTDPATVVHVDLAARRIDSVTDPLTHITYYNYDGNGRLMRVTMPELNSMEYTYDTRGNVTRLRLREKDDTNDYGDDIVTEADYPAVCSNIVTCNSPTATRDALGNQTDYTYDSTHGGVLTVTQPAPSSGAVRPQTRYFYGQVTAVSGQPVYQLTGISACAVGSTASPTCVGTADETRTVINYDSINIRPTSIETRSGNGSGTGALSATTTLGYNAHGDVTSVDGPLAGSDDAIYVRYDAARRRVGTISADPDGSGTGHPLKRRAQRTTWRDDGQIGAVETGTVEGTSDSDWAAMTVLEGVQTEFDANHRPAVQRLVSGGTTYQLTQTGYDGLGRVHCVAQRMNPDEFASASLPADACALDSEGSFGPDRIARTSYDLAGRVTRVETGYGVSGVAADEATTTYTANGQVESVTDAEGNKTTYVYDGFDRLSRTRMPSPTQGAGTSSTSDYEELGYDAAGNVTSRRLRDGASIGYSYDALNRLTGIDRPTYTGVGYLDLLDSFYAYDNLGHMIAATHAATTQPGQAQWNLGFGYDALGRQISQTDPLGTVGYSYDPAGQRTSMSYPGSGLVIGYVYDNAGDLTEIRENPSGSNGLLATYAYDDRGRRQSLTRNNGLVTGYSYDAVSRLSQLTQDVNGSASDLTLGFSYNPAGQLAGNSRSNDSYSFVLANGARTDSVDGLNRVTAVGGTGTAHDANGNLIYDPGSSGAGARSFGFASEGALINAWPHSMIYDPAGRLVQTDTGSGFTIQRFGYDGDNLIAEYDVNNAVARRYVFGPGGEPVVWYEGSGTSTRRYFQADERGSVIAVTDGVGNLYGSVNRYDEYGVPQGTLTGRFGYTGQVWLPDSQVYDYRNRTYLPSLGRFLQPDPISYDGGMNLYAYVLNDPVNLVDPLGLTHEVGLGTATVTGHRPLPQNILFNVFVHELLRVSLADSDRERADDDCEGSDDPNCNIELRGTRVPQAVPRRPAVYLLQDNTSGGEEHTRNARPSTQEKHERGQARQNRDRGGEKADEGRRPPRRRPRGHLGPWPRPRVPGFFPFPIIPYWLLDVCLSPLYPFPRPPECGVGPPVA